MRRFSLAILLLLAPVIFTSSIAQTAQSKDEERLLALIQEVQTQQAQMADNQAKIESKLADLAELIRQARIYSKREK